MSVEFVCPACGKQLRAQAEHAGLATQCPKRHATLTIPMSPLVPESVAPPPPAVLPAIAVGPALETGNPYQSPLGSAALDALPADMQLASRGQRFLGAMLDNILYILVASMVTGVIVATAIFFGAQLTEDDLVVYGALGIGLLEMVGLQSLLLATRGLTLGKILLKTKIVSLESGQIPRFLKGVVVRYWLPIFLILPDIQWLKDNRGCSSGSQAAGGVLPCRFLSRASPRACRPRGRATHGDGEALRQGLTAAVFLRRKNKSRSRFGLRSKSLDGSRQPLKTRKSQVFWPLKILRVGCAASQFVAVRCDARNCPPRHKAVLICTLSGHVH